jgi:SAM-dependent methyltransferase
VSPIREEEQARADFGERYGRTATRAVREVERAVIGDVWGANGYTTVVQADLLAEQLRVGGGSRLLDVGAGRGWPGLYIAKRTGCDVVVTDLPIEGLVVARRRARKERLRSAAVVSSAWHLPFREGSFDAISHTDVLC